MALLTRIDIESGVGLANLQGSTGMVAASTGSDTFPNDDRTWVVIENTTGSTGATVTATLAAAKVSVAVPSYGDVALAALIQAVTYDATKSVFGFLSGGPGVVNAAGVATLTIDTPTGVNVGVYRRAQD